MMRQLFLILCLLLIITSPALAGTINLPYSYGFESGNLAGGNFASLNSSNIDFTNTASAHTGTYGYGVNVYTGDNITDGGIYTDTTSPVLTTDVYARWYMRWPTNVRLTQFQKLFYFLGTYNCLDFDSGNLTLETASANAAINWGWGDIMQGCTHANYASCPGDGLWHEYEVHIRSNGFWEMWTDGVYRGSATNTSPAGLTGIIEFMTNGHGLVVTGSVARVDIDDIAIATTGPIGPIGGADTTAPSITQFSLYNVYHSLTVPVIVFAATDPDDTTIFYCAKPYQVNPPLSTDSCWVTNPAGMTVTFAAQGAVTARGWAKDAAGNISTPINYPVTITLATQGTCGAVGGGSSSSISSSGNCVRGTENSGAIGSGTSANSNYHVPGAQANSYTMAVGAVGKSYSASKRGKATTTIAGAVGSGTAAKIKRGVKSTMLAGGIGTATSPSLNQHGGVKHRIYAMTVGAIGNSYTTLKRASKLLMSTGAIANSVSAFNYSSSLRVLMTILGGTGPNAIFAGVGPSIFFDGNGPLMIFTGGY